MEYSVFFAYHINLFNFFVIYCFVYQFYINSYRLPKVKMKYIQNFYLNYLAIKKGIFSVL